MLELYKFDAATKPKMMIKDLLSLFQFTIDKAVPAILKMVLYLALLLVLIFLDAYFDFSRSIFFSHKYEELDKIRVMIQDPTLTPSDVAILKGNRQTLLKSPSLSQKIYNRFFGFNDTFPEQDRFKYHIRNFSFFWYFASFIPFSLIALFIIGVEIRFNNKIGPLTKKSDRQTSFVLTFLITVIISLLFLNLTVPDQDFSKTHRKIMMRFSVIFFVLYTLLSIKYFVIVFKKTKKYFSAPKAVRERQERIRKIAFAKSRLL